MPCPECGSFQTTVLWSGWTEEDGWVRRRRKCNNCGCRWNSVETIIPLSYHRKRGRPNKEVSDG